MSNGFGNFNISGDLGSFGNFSGNFDGFGFNGSNFNFKMPNITFNGGQLNNIFNNLFDVMGNFTN